MSKPQVTTLQQKIRHQLPFYISLSLVLGVIGIVCSTYVIHRFYWSNTNYGIGDCRVQAPTDPKEIVRGNDRIPPLTGCTGVKVGWPAAFAKSDVEISVGVDNPQTPVPISELFGFGNIFLSLSKFLIDWLFWSILGFLGICLFVWRKLRVKP